MTVKEFMGSLDSYPDMESTSGISIKDSMMRLMHVWSNAACSGYALAAMEDAGLADEDICAVLKLMQDAYSMVTVEDAEAAFNDRISMFG